MRCVPSSIRVSYPLILPVETWAMRQFGFSGGRRILSAGADSLRLYALEQEGARRAPAGERARRCRCGWRADPGVPQCWKRNTLVVDLQSASGTGRRHVEAERGGQVPGSGSPSGSCLARLVARSPGGSAHAVAGHAEGTKPVDLELVLGVYTAKTSQISVKWEPAEVFEPRFATRRCPDIRRQESVLIGGALFAESTSIALSAPPHTQPVSSPTTPCVSHGSLVRTSDRRFTRTS